jgi:hypothetical protein
MLTLQGNTRIAFLLFFASHIPITLLIDGQAFFRRSLYPQAFQDVVDWYAATFKVRDVCGDIIMNDCSDLNLLLFSLADLLNRLFRTS